MENNNSILSSNDNSEIKKNISKSTEIESSKIDVEDKIFIIKKNKKHRKLKYFIIIFIIF